jgi:hypothetical protein
MWGVELHAFLSSALDEGELSASRSGSFNPGSKAPWTYWIGGWVGLRVDPDSVVNLKTRP